MAEKDVQPAPETAPAPMPAPAVEQPTTDGTPPAVDAPAPPRRVKERRIRERRAAHIEVLYEGHGKGHYLGWGIADWVIAGGMWAGALTAALEAVFFAALANAFDNNHPRRPSGAMDRRRVRCRQHRPRSRWHLRGHQRGRQHFDLARDARRGAVAPWALALLPAAQACRSIPCARRRGKRRYGISGSFFEPGEPS